MKKLFSNSESKKILALLLFLAILVYIRRTHGLLQEDNYVGYAVSFRDGLKSLTYYDSRLFPGFPILIYIYNFIFRVPIVSAYAVMFSAYIGSLLLLNKLTKVKDNLLLFLFPPVMLDLVTKVANEYITIFLVLLGVYYFFKKKYDLTSFVAGLSIWVRPVVAVLFPALLITLYLRDRKKITPKLFIFFLVPLLAFMIFNHHYFDSYSPMYQIFVYKKVSPYGNAVGYTQILIGFVTTFVKGQYNVFFSGLFYFVLFVYGLVRIYKNFPKLKKANELFIVLSIILMIVYVFTYSFKPFLQNLARYIMPMIFLWYVLFRDKFKIPGYAYLLVFASIAIALF